MLSEVLNSIDGIDSEVVCGVDKARLSEILKTAHTLNLNTPDSSVALAIKNPVELIRHLIGLDGYVRTIVLISPESSSTELQRRLRYFENCRLVTDDTPIHDTAEASAGKGSRVLGKRHKTAWILATSGTTAVPKQVVHSFQSLTRTTKVGNGSAYRWGVLYDPYRFAGLQVILQGLLGNSSIVFPNLELSIKEQLNFLVAEKVNALSATPTLWRKILMCDNSKDLELRTISLGGEIVDDGILRALASTYPKATIRHIYASTEAGTGFSIDDGRAGFPKRYLTQPFDGIELKISNQTLHIKNPHVNAQYVADSESFTDEDGFIDTGDRVVVEADRVYFRGRLSGVINVGGNKVFPEHVESVLVTISNVSFVRVYGHPSSIVGQLVMADIVVHDKSDIEQTRIELNRKADKELQSFERPTHYNFIDVMEHTHNGKVLRK